MVEEEPTKEEIKTFQDNETKKAREIRQNQLIEMRLFRSAKLDKLNADHDDPLKCDEETEDVFESSVGKTEYEQALVGII